ncbi:MAG: hypothetical protein IIT65_01860 [Lachnospiraceae bacterium]|nr:hypothetical protein [Lachnospiraceae bacterium]
MDGKVIIKDGDVIDKAMLETLRPIFADGYNVKDITINEELDQYNKVQTIKIYDPKDEKKVITVIGNDQSIDSKRLTISDVYAATSYYLNLLAGFGNVDEIDHLGNRRVSRSSRSVPPWLLPAQPVPVPAEP